VIALDTSVLAYAVNRFAPEHARAARAVEVLANGDGPWALPWTVVHEFLHLVTHPHAVVRPMRATDAGAFLDRLLGSPTVRLLAPGERHAAVVTELLAATDLVAGLPPGFETAAVLHEHGVRELLTTDRGMGRYGFLAIIDPVHGPVWTPAAPPVRRYRRLQVRGSGRRP